MAPSLLNEETLVMSLNENLLVSHHFILVRSYLYLKEAQQGERGSGGPISEFNKKK